MLFLGGPYGSDLIVIIFLELAETKPIGCRAKEEVQMVTMFYCVKVDGFNADVSKVGPFFGAIVSRHTEDTAAEKEAQKINGKSVVVREAMVLRITSESKLEVGVKYPELVWQAYVEKAREVCVWRCKQILERLRVNEDFDENHYLSTVYDEYGVLMEFDEFIARFGEDAEKLIEAETRRIQAQAEMSAHRQSVVKSFANAADSVTFSFPAVKGVQAGREFYTAQVQLKYLVRLFTFADENLPAELRAQRKVNESHAKDISNYVAKNRFDYVLPAITASVNSAMFFEPFNAEGLADRLGVLRIPMDAVILINDGQHRRMAVELALQSDRSLGDETIPVVLYFDEGLARSKQIFSDLNAHLVKPSAAISALYDLRNPYNKYVLKKIEGHQEVNRFVDKENTTIGVKSHMIWSLVHYKKFFLQLTGLKEICFEHDSLQNQFGSLVNGFPDYVITAMVEMITPLRLALSGEISAEQLRSDYVAGHAVYLESLALALNGLKVQFTTTRDAVFSAMAKIATLSTERTAEHWVGRCVLADRMVKTSDSVKLTAALMRRAAGIPLSESMVEAEVRHGLSQ